MPEPTVVVAAAVVQRGRSYLVTRRLRGTHLELAGPGSIVLADDRIAVESINLRVGQQTQAKTQLLKGGKGFELPGLSSK